MWFVRLAVLGILVVLDVLGMLLLRYRDRVPRLAESTLFNCLLMILYYPFVLLLFLLPPDAGWGARPAWFDHPGVRVGFPVVGLLLFAAGACLGLATLRQRRVIGAQDAAEGLLTDGLYAHARHPIWTGLLWMLLALPLLARNPDGLLVFPAYALLVWGETVMEERCDMRRRFPDAYARYSQHTPMFGPAWAWAIPAATLAALAAWALAHS